MFYLGIDIAKNTHVASLIDEKGKNIFKGFSFLCGLLLLLIFSYHSLYNIFRFFNKGFTYKPIASIIVFLYNY